MSTRTRRPTSRGGWRPRTGLEGSLCLCSIITSTRSEATTDWRPWRAATLLCSCRTTTCRLSHARGSSALRLRSTGSPRSLSSAPRRARSTLTRCAGLRRVCTSRCRPRMRR
eukprot:Amastigsp_a859124_3.p4 type:complete len:112 gc:universal Amastigsp_a859124_3:388-723(+)